MRKIMVVWAVTLAGLLAGCGPQPGYGPGAGYGPSYGYGPQSGYYGQPAPNPMAQLLGAMLAPTGGYGQPYYGAPSYGTRYF